MREWNPEWLSLNDGSLEEWTELCQQAEKVENVKPFSKSLPRMETVVDIIMGKGSWVAGEDFPAEAVAERSPSGLLLQTETSAAFLVRVTPDSRLDLSLANNGSHIWDCLPPCKWSALRRYSIEMGETENGTSCFGCRLVNKKSAEGGKESLLIERKKGCEGVGIVRRLYHVEVRDGEGEEAELSPYALFFATYPSGTQPSAWPVSMTKSHKKEPVKKALRMRPSLLSKLVNSIPATRDFSKAKEAYREESGGSENLQPGEQISHQAMKRRWETMRAAENLPRLGRGGSKSALNDSLVRSCLNRNADIVLCSQLEMNPGEDIGLRIALRHPLAVDDLRRCCLANSSPAFRSGLQVDTSFGDYYVTAVVCQDEMFQNQEQTARSTPLLLMVHDRRTLADFLWLGQALGTLSKMNPREQKENPVSAVATDGDAALVDGFMSSCPLLEGAAHAGCYNHMVDNIKSAIRSKFPSLVPSQKKLISQILGAEFPDGREEGGLKKRSRLTGLVDCVSTSLRGDWAELRSRLEEDITSSDWGPEEDADDRLSAFLGFADHAEAYWVQRWENSFCLDSRQRFNANIGVPIVSKIVTNRIEGLWPGLHKAVEGRRGLHEILEESCSFLRRHFADKKAAVLGMETDHLKVSPQLHKDYVLSTAGWVGPGREEAKAKALTKVWPSLSAKAKPHPSFSQDSEPTCSQTHGGGLVMEEETELLISASDFFYNDVVIEIHKC